MVPSPYLVPKGRFCTKTTINKSIFIASLYHIKSLDEMRDRLADCQKQHSKANHNCWAALAGAPDDSKLYGFSDDGEPSNTAGRPIFNVLRHAGIGQAGIIVSRYFGGIKLGTGGLIRAYTEAAKQVIDQAEFKRFCEQTYLYCSFAYDKEGIFRHLLEQSGLRDGKDATFHYSDKVEVHLSLDTDKTSSFSKNCMARLGGDIIISSA